MKYLSWIIGLATLCSVSTAQAQCMTDCCIGDPCDMTYSVDVSYLYWKVARNELYRDADEGDYEYLNPESSHGVRVGVFAHSNCYDFGARYTFFESDDSKTIGGNLTDHDFDLHVLDLEMGYTCDLPCCCLALRPFAGAKIAWVEEDINAASITNAKLDYVGYGLYVGMESHFDLCTFDLCGCKMPIGIVTRGSAGILRGEFDYKLNSDTRTDQYLYNSVLEAYAALDVTFCDIFCDYDANLQIGYEVQSWSNWRFHSNESDVGDLGFGGLVVKVGMEF